MLGTPAIFRRSVPKGRVYISPRVEPTRGTSEAQPWVNEQPIKQKPEGLALTASGNQDD